MEKLKYKNIVYLKSNKYKTNKISLSYIIDDLKDYPYLQILTNILYSGSKKYPSKKDINNYIEDLYDSSISLAFHTYGLKGVFEISVTYLMDKYTNIDITRKIVDLLDSLVNEPLFIDGLFNEEYLDREKRLIVEALESEFDNKSRYAIKELTKLNSLSRDFKEYAYLNISDIEAITNEKLVETYKKYINNDNLLVYVMGEVDLEHLVIFESNNPKELSGFTKELNFIPNDKEYVEERDVNQTIVTVNYLTNVNFLDQDKAREITLLNHILGGDSNSLLFRVVREQYNFCYSIYSTFNNFTGVITIVVGLDEVNKEKCIELIDELIKSLTEEIDDIVLENAVLSLKESILDGVDSQSITLKRSFTDDLFNRTSNVHELIEKYRSIPKKNLLESAKSIKKDVSFILRRHSNENN